MNNSLKKNFKNKKKIIAYWITRFDLSTLEITLKTEAFDCYVVDMEHSSINYQNLEEMIRLIDAYQKPTLVRIEKVGEKNISKSLDLGASGIIAPNINSIIDLNKLIDFVYYPPKGKRGVGLSRANEHGKTFNEYFKSFNSSVVIIPMIENIKAFQSINQIVQNKNIDAVFIGPYDLSSSIGVPGKFNSNKFKNIMKKILTAVKKQKLSCGLHLVQTQKKSIKSIFKQGYNFIALYTDIQIFIDGMKDKLKLIKKV